MWAETCVRRNRPCIVGTLQAVGQTGPRPTGRWELDAPEGQGNTTRKVVGDGAWRLAEMCIRSLMKWSLQGKPQEEGSMQRPGAGSCLQILCTT